MAGAALGPAVVLSVSAYPLTAAIDSISDLKKSNQGADFLAKQKRRKPILSLRRRRRRKNERERVLVRSSPFRERILRERKRESLERESERVEKNGEGGA